MATSAERSHHPNEPDEIRRKLERDAVSMTDRERDEVRAMIDTAMSRLASDQEPPVEPPAR
jgi:hypothetical protein